MSPGAYIIATSCETRYNGGVSSVASRRGVLTISSRFRVPWPNPAQFRFVTQVEKTMLLAPVAMHIPDGFLSVSVSVVLWVLTIAIIAYALRRVNDDLGERQVPMMAVVAAAVFAGQMLNF